MLITKNWGLVQEDGEAEKYGHHSHRRIPSFDPLMSERRSSQRCWCALALVALPSFSNLGSPVLNPMRRGSCGEMEKASLKLLGEWGNGEGE